MSNYFRGQISSSQRYFHGTVSFVFAPVHNELLIIQYAKKKQWEKNLPYQATKILTTTKHKKSTMQRQFVFVGLFTCEQMASAFFW